MEPQIQYAKTSDGARLAYGIFGESGDAVVLVPSLGRGGRDFAELASALVENGYRAVTVDPRGVGESTGPITDLTMHDLAADVASVIESMGGEPVHAVGHAFGNRVVRCLATDRPELVRTVTLLAAGGMVEPAAAIREAGLRCFQLHLPDAERLDAVQAAFFSPGNDASVWRQGWWPEAAVIQGRANFATPVEEWWEAGSVPLLVVQGLDDATAPVANGYALKEQLGDRVKLVDIADAGHALLPEQPEEIKRAILAFFAQH
jgi:pimeloyl-ACP methyl ester carboxylesterase